MRSTFSASYFGNSDTIWSAGFFCILSTARSMSGTAAASSPNTRRMDDSIIERWLSLMVTGSGRDSKNRAVNSTSSASWDTWGLPYISTSHWWKWR